MGNDGPLACLADQPRLTYDYFRQLFAQVTNPPIDPIRESIVMSLECYIGPQGNILDVRESQCHRLMLPSPVLSLESFNALKNLQSVHSHWPVCTLDITFDKSHSVKGYVNALQRVCEEASEAVDDGFKIIILSDRNTGPTRVPISALAACGSVHHHLVRTKMRSKVALVVETGEAREVHHLCVLVAYGADAICPYLALECLLKLHRENALKGNLPAEKVVYNYLHSCDNGILKVMSKMGISTLQSYRGAQIFEALGVEKAFVDRHFTWTDSRIGGIGIDAIADETRARHEQAFPTRPVAQPDLDEGGEYQWRRDGEFHLFNPDTVQKLQHATRSGQYKVYKEYTQLVNNQNRKRATLRGLFDLKFAETPLP